MALSSVPGCAPAYLLVEKRFVPIDDYAGFLQLRAKSGWGDKWWVLLVDGVLQAPFQLPDDSTEPIPIEFNPKFDTHTIYAIPLGYWSYIPPSAKLDLVRNFFELTFGTALDVEWDAELTFDDRNTSSQLSSWSLSGLRRFTNGRPVEGWSTRMRLDIVLTNNGGDYTLQLYDRTQLLAEGTRTGNGSITLTEQNNSGVTGSVTVAYSADIVAGDNAWVEVRWPSQYLIYEGDSLLATVDDNGHGNTQSTRLEEIGSGSHSIKMKVVTDCAQTSGFGSATAKTVPFRPPSPASLAYLDGDWTDTRLTFSSGTPAWTGSSAKSLRQWVVPSTGPAGYAYECTVAGTTDSGEPTWPTTEGDTVVDGGVTWTCRAQVTYRVYDSELDEPINLDAASKTASAATGTITVALDSLASAAAGKRRIQVNAVCDGAEDPEGMVLEVEYDSSGDVVQPGPNSPTFWRQSVVGRLVTVHYNYNGAGDQITPDSVKLWVTQDGSTPDWDNPDASESISARDDYGVVSGNISFTVAADGFFNIIVRVADANGNLSPNTTEEGPEWFGAGLPSVPTPRVEVAA